MCVRWRCNDSTHCPSIRRRRNIQRSRGCWQQRTWDLSISITIEEWGSQKHNTLTLPWLVWKTVVYSTYNMKNGSTQQQMCYRMMGPNKFATWNKHVHLKGLPGNIWLLSQMWWSWIMQSDSTWLVMGPNRIPRACGLVNCLLTVFLYKYSQSRQNWWQTSKQSRRNFPNAVAG